MNKKRRFKEVVFDYKKEQYQKLLDKELKYIRENLPMEDLKVDDVTIPMQEKPKINRVYKGSIDVDHDLFKLEVASMKKNISIDDDKPIYESIEHCHFYHSYDSSGKRQYLCSPIAGHSHKVDVDMDKEGNLIATSGPAIRRIGGKDIPLKEDDHNHNVSYVRSEKIKVREVNAEATKTADKIYSTLQNK